MKVKIIKISICNSKTKVVCQTDYGNVSLYWMGSNPQVDQTYEVELESNETLIWNKNIFVSQEKNTIYDENNSIKIVGALESIDADGYLILRIDNSIVTFMSKEIPMVEEKKVQVYVNFMEAYPIEY